MRSMSPNPRQCRHAAGALVIAIAACSSDAGPAEDSAADSARASSEAPAAAAAPSGPPTDAGTDGLWTMASLEKRLDLQGMVPRRMPDSVRHGFLTIPGTVYQLGNAELQVFLYEDARALAADIGKLDTITVSPPASPVPWPRKATLITNANLAAILLSENALQIERVQRAIMAGTGSTVFGPGAPR